MRRCVNSEDARGVYFNNQHWADFGNLANDKDSANAESLVHQQLPARRFSEAVSEKAFSVDNKRTRTGSSMPAIETSKLPRTHPQISLHSFVLGFVIGCIVVYVLHNTICGGEGCQMDQNRVLVQVEAIPSSSLVYINKMEDEDDGDKVARNGEAEPSVDHSLHRRSTRGRQRTQSDDKEAERDAMKKTRVNERPDNGAAAVNLTVKSSSSSGCPSRQLHLVILILSAPGGVIRRNAIRGTWLHNYHSGMLKVTSRFLIGTNRLIKEKIGNLTIEQNQFDDLLFFDDLKDSYSNLSSKVLLGLRWAYETQKFDFLIKTDDDSYVRIDQVTKNLQQMNCNDRLYWGYFMGHALPEPSGKWAEHGWFNCQHYLPYAMGGGYVMSRGVLSLIMRFSHRLKLYNNEDVTVGSWTAPFKLFRKHDIRFDVESLSHGCNNHYIITHKERVRSLYEKYTNLLKNGTICETEKEIRPAYIYNWDVSPVDCCTRTRGLQVSA